MDILRHDRLHQKETSLDLSQSSLSDRFYHEYCHARPSMTYGAMQLHVER